MEKGSYRVHELKTWPSPFEAIFTGGKRHEILDNRNREFAIGDELILREWNPIGPPQSIHNPIGCRCQAAGYTGRRLRARVQFVTKGGNFGLPHNLDVLTIEPSDRLLVDEHEEAEPESVFLLAKAEVFYRCAACGDSHEVTYQSEDGYSTKIEGIIAYLCDNCGHGVAVVQTKVSALEVPDEGA